jgi:hypothetical protein
MQEHNYSLTELENMMRWERDVYIAMLLRLLEKKKQQKAQQQR